MLELIGVEVDPQDAVFHERCMPRILLCAAQAGHMAHDSLSHQRAQCVQAKRVQWMRNHFRGAHDSREICHAGRVPSLVRQ